MAILSDVARLSNRLRSMLADRDRESVAAKASDICGLKDMPAEAVIARESDSSAVPLKTLAPVSEV
jgi:hypothetical protein